MRIGILKAGQPSADLESLVGSYPEMIRAAFGPAYTYQEFDATAGDLPSGDRGADAYVITGSASSVYESDPWIAGLREWLTAVDPATPLVGICFGHQIMAAAYGGFVMKATQGLAVGLHRYRVSSRVEWMDDSSEFVIPVSHYDQVVEAPSRTRVVATSDFCPYAALAYSDRRAISFQGHPEFSLELTALAIDRWLHKGVIGEDQATLARESLRLPDDRSRVVGWIRRFIDADSRRVA